MSSIVEEELRLPPTWGWAGVSDVALEMRYGTSAKCSPDKGEVPVLRMGNIVNGELDFTNLKYLPEGHKEFPELLLTPGDVVFNRTNSAELVGKTAVFRTYRVPCSLASYLIRVRVHPEFSPEILAHFINSYWGRLWIASVVSQQVGQANVSGGKLKACRIPVPPRAEQQRIAEAIDSYTTRLKVAVDGLQRVQANLKRYRASVLKAAVEGRLVPTEAELARAEGRDHEPASALLERILVERRKRWEQAELAKMKAKGKPPKNDKWKAKYKEPAPPETSELPELPEGWRWTTVEQLVWMVKDGPHYSPKYAEEGVPFISGGNVRPEGVDFDSAKRVAPELHEEFCVRIRPEVGDVLYTKGGTTGIARVNTYLRPFSVWVHVAVLKLAGVVDPFYLQHALNSPWCYAQAQRYTHGVGNQDLGLTRMIKITVPLPPVPEQHRIVGEVDRLHSVIAEMEGQVATNTGRCARLRQSILRWAFEGKLVDQDSNDEPASVLLERIRAEREATPTKKTRKPRKKRAKR